MHSRKLTASGLSFASGCSNFHLFVRGMSITPSTITWETCTPLGPNSLASDCASALRANLPVANAEKVAEPLMLAVAPVKINVGGYSSPIAFNRRGKTACAKRKPPFLFVMYCHLAPNERWIQSHLPLALETSRELLFGQFQKRLPYKPTTGIKHGSGQFCVPELLCDLAEGILHALRIRQVGADAHGLSAAGVDLLHQWVEAGWISSKNYDGIRLGESPCYRCALQIGLIRSTRDPCGGGDWGTLKMY